MPSAQRKQPADKTLDETTQLERALLACILEHPNLIGQIEVDLAGCFLHADHRTLWRAAAKLHSEGIILDPILWHQESKVDFSYIALLRDECIIPENFQRYVRNVQGAARARQYARLYEELGNSNPDDRPRILEQMQQTCTVNGNGTRPIRESESKRKDMPESVLDGKLGEICQSRLKAFPVAYVWPALLTIAGSSLSLKHDRTIRSNLYACLVGNVDTGKTQAVEQVMHVLGISKLDPILLSGKYGSSEGLVNDLKEQGSCVRLLYPDELLHLLWKCNIENSSFASFLNTAFGTDKQQGGTGQKNWEIDCRLSILGGLPEDLFEDGFGSASVGGLYDRFLFGLAPRPHNYDYYPPKGPAEQFCPYPSDVCPDVWELLKDWKKEGIPGRVAQICLRAAYICAAFDGRPMLRAAELQPARALAENQVKVRQCLQPNAGLNFDAKSANSILKWLQEHTSSGEWAKRRDLSRGINSNRLGPGVFNRALLNLQSNDEIELESKIKLVRLVLDPSI